MSIIATYNSPSATLVVDPDALPGLRTWRGDLIHAAGATGAAIVSPRQDLPFVDFGGRDWSGFLASRSRNFRNGLPFRTAVWCRRYPAAGE